MKKNIDIKSRYRYFLSFVGYVLLTAIGKGHAPYSLALLVANLTVGLKIFPSLILYSIPYLASLNVVEFLTTFSAGIIVSVTFLFYRKYKRTPKLELAILTAVSLLPFLVLTTRYDQTVKGIISATVVLSSFAFIPASKVWLIKGIKYKASKEEFIPAVFLLIASGYGACVILGTHVYNLLAVGVILLLLGALSEGKITLVSLLLSVAPSLYSWSFYPLALLTFTTLFAVAFCNSKLLTVISVVFVEVFFRFFTSVYEGYPFIDALYLLIPCVIYLFVPKKFYLKLKDDLKIYGEKSLDKYIINRDRLLISGKLFEISSVFDEMSASLNKISAYATSPESVKSNMVDEILLSVCSDCSARGKCRNENKPSYDELYKSVDIAISKGRLNLIDLPKSLGDACFYPYQILKKINYLVKEYERDVLKTESINEGRELIKKQTVGLSEVLKELATEFSRQTGEKQDLENKIRNELLTLGIYTLELNVLGDEEDIEINIVLQDRHLLKQNFIKGIEKAVGFSPVITAKTNLSNDFSAITLKKAPKLDAVFGISQASKDDNLQNGDNHSVMKISESKFLMALGDGMGSGDIANSSSSTAVSLIETFYKSGIPSDITLSTVNKVLTFNKEDNYTAMDIGSIDLITGNAEFIKIGSPYSFIITKDKVKIIEGTSLPLGILDEMQPTVCKTVLSPGDIVVFISDGISDAFSSSADLIDFLSNERTVNPKTMADNILSKAIELSGGIKKDDMTAFCVRIYEKAS